MMLNFNSYEDIKDKLQIRIYDPDFSRDLLDGKVVTYVGDFALIYIATLYESEEYLGHLMFTPGLINNLGIDIQTLHRDAMENNLNWGTTLFTTEDFISAMANKRPLFSINLFNRNPDNINRPLPMVTLTKDNYTNGASLIIHKGIRKKIGDVIGGDFYVLPSSIHEVMVVSADIFDPDELTDVVTDCNSKIFPKLLDSEDILSDKVQWCSKDGEIMKRAVENE